MSDIITVTGLIATDPRHLITGEGRLPITSFRLASTQRRFDRKEQKWVDADTNWFTVTAFRQMATNAAGSLNKGDRIVVTGRMRIRDWESGERNGTTVEIEADAVGHDLYWGTTSFSRTIQSSLTRQEDQAEEAFPEVIQHELAAQEAEATEPAVTTDSLALPF